MAYIADIPLLLFSFLLILNYKRVADLPSWCRQILPVVVKSAGSTAVQVHGLICPGLLHHFGQLGDGSSAGGQQDQLVIASQPALRRVRRRSPMERGRVMPGKLEIQG